MDATLIFMGIAILVVIYLIFKFIKKLVFAVFTLILFLVLVVVGIAGLVYMDYSYLTSQNDFDLKVVYQKDGKYEFASNVKIINKTPDMNSIKSITSTELAALKPEDISSDDKVFVIVVDEELFKSILTKDKYEIEQFKTADFASYDLSLTKFEVIEIMDSTDDVQTFLDILFKKNKITGVEKSLMEPVAKSMIQSELEKRHITLKEAVFLTVVSEEMKVEKNTINVVEGFKNEQLQVYPDRFVFKLVRLLPVEMVKSYLPGFEKN